MTLAELLDAAYRSEYVDLCHLEDIDRFAESWKNFLGLNIEDLDLKIRPGL